MAKAEPTAGIHQGTVGGITKASSNPVRKALPSLMERGRFIINSQITSVNKAKIIEMAIIPKACQRKKMTPAIAAGTKEADTIHIIPFVSSSVLICGGAETITFVSNKDINSL